MSIDVRRAADRFVTHGDAITTWHGLSYGVHYDPDNVAFGPIVAINTEQVGPGAGYDPHRHRDVEIVTWVVDGGLRHDDTAGGGGVVRPGTAQRLSAGTGVQHTEANASADEPLTFVQMMLVSDRDGEPEYEQADVPATTGRLLDTVAVHAPARLLVVRLEREQAVLVPAAPRSLVHVTRGSVLLRDTLLLAGDEVRLTGAGPYDLSAAGDTSDAGGEVLVWQLEA